MTDFTVALAVDWLCELRSAAAVRDVNHRSLRPTERERESLDWKILWEVLMVVGMDSGVDFFGRGLITPNIYSLEIIYDNMYIIRYIKTMQ